MMGTMMGPTSTSAESRNEAPQQRKNTEGCQTRQEKTKPTRKHIGEAAIQPKSTQSEGRKRSKNNMLEGREGKTEK